MKEPNITTEYPPKEIYDRCVKEFGVNMKTGTVFTVGNNIHIDKPEDMTPDLLVHETTHVRQQEKIGSDTWWHMYFEDPSFRLEQEVEAYSAQYKYAKENYVRKHHRMLLDAIAKDLSGQTYGYIVTTAEAKELIKANATTR